MMGLLTGVQRCGYYALGMPDQGAMLTFPLGTVANIPESSIENSLSNDTLYWTIQDNDPLTLTLDCPMQSIICILSLTTATVCMVLYSYYVR